MSNVVFFSYGVRAGTFIMTYASPLYWFLVGFAKAIKISLRGVEKKMEMYEVPDNLEER